MSIETNETKVALRGVFGNKKEVVSRLEAAGLEIVSLVGQADILLTEGSIPSSTIKRAKEAGKTIVDAQAYLASLSLLEGASDIPIIDLPRRPAIEFGEDWVRIMDIVVPRNTEPGPLCPPSTKFRHFTFDGPTLHAARTVALGVRNKMAVLLEGETATAKTSTIRWVAHLTGNQLTRVNLNGQTDTSELVGRYIPSGGLANIDIWAYKEFVETHINDPEVNLEPETQQLILQACAANNGRGRLLTQVEIQQVMANEQLQQPQWSFQEGSIPQALREGHWVILDEVNLAEAQVLERLNPVLENPPSLYLTEGNGTRFGGAGGVPIHPDFRMFSTMNPATYAGRTALSPAYRDRWRISQFVDTPGEKEILEMLRRLVFGEQPEIIWRGIVYQSDQSEAIYPALQMVDGIEELLVSLSVFHSSITFASGGSSHAASIGRTRRERYIFTRRTMLAVMDLLANHTVMGSEGERIDVQHRASFILEDILESLYVSRIQDESDRQSVRTAIRAAGLGGNL